MAEEFTGSEDGKVYQYFAPFYGIGVGALISWYASYSSGAENAEPSVWLGRSFAITTSLIMWSLFTTTLQNKKIFGGGMYARGGDSRREIPLCISLFALWSFTVIAYVTNQPAVFWSCSMLQLLILVGEVGWRDPVYLYNRCLGKHK